MTRATKSYSLLLLCLLTALYSCKSKDNTKGKLQVVTTTSMITDMVSTIGGDSIQVSGLMGSGVDPHLYRASEGDVTKLYTADLVFYNGLHLEGKLVDVFEKMGAQKQKTLAIANSLDKSTLIGSAYFASNYDPHIWFDIDYWKKASGYVTEELASAVPESALYFRKNNERYQRSLDSLKEKLRATIAKLPEEKRVLVTAHDAFNYFGRAFGFEVIGLQGLSTATEAGVQDVQKLADFIISRNIKAIFVESSVPRRTIEALQAAVKDRGHEVQIGGTLFSDALGSPDTPEGKYIGMFSYNVNTIVEALN